MREDVARGCGISGFVGRKLQFAKERQALVSMKDRLDSLRYWTPARQVSKLVEEDVLPLVDGLGKRLEAKAIVAVVGGSGAGKSTLVNALCGKDATVMEGHDRPTTRRITALARSVGDANALLADFGKDELSVATDSEFRFHDVVLLDTPDTDSTECADYSELLDRMLQRADVLLCVFPAQDPKRRDNLKRLAEKVSKYQAEHVFLVLNQCDRIERSELDEISADFEQNLKKSWKKSGRMFRVSARSSLANPNWTDGERPLHSVNEFKELCSAIDGLGGSHFADRRIERARELRVEVEDSVRRMIKNCGDVSGLRGKLEDFEKALVARLVDQAASAISSRVGIYSSALDRKVSERWHGPVGVYLHLALLLKSIGSSLRFLNPVNWTKRAVLKYQMVFGASPSSEELMFDEAVSLNWGRAKSFVVERWSDISSELVNDFGMTPDLIDGEKAVVFDGLEASLQRTWSRGIHDFVESMAVERSRTILQVVANLPFLAVSLYALYEMFHSFWEHRYMQSEYYPHLLAILLLVWLLPSWLVQSRAGGTEAKIKVRMKKALESSDISAHVLPVLEDVRILESMAAGG